MGWNLYLLAPELTWNASHFSIQILNDALSFWRQKTGGLPVYGAFNCLAAGTAAGPSTTTFWFCWANCWNCCWIAAFYCCISTFCCCRSFSRWVKAAIWSWWFKFAAALPGGVRLSLPFSIKLWKSVCVDSCAKRRCGTFECARATKIGVFQAFSVLNFVIDFLQPSKLFSWLFQNGDRQRNSMQKHF